MDFVVLASIAAAAAQAAAAPGDAAPPADPDSAVSGVVVQAQKPITGNLQAGVLSLQPSFFIKLRPTTAMDMVQWLPGFSFQDTRDTRGLEGSGGNVLIDGKPPTSKTDTLQSVLKRIPSEQIERIDIITGGAPGIDMHGWPMIANVILKKSATQRKTITVANQVDHHGHDAPTLSMNSSDKTDQRTVEASLEVGETMILNPPLGEGAWTRTDATGAPLFTAKPTDQFGGPYATASGAYDQALAGGRLRFNGSGRYYGTNYDEQDHLSIGPSDSGFTHTQTYQQGELGAAYEHPLGGQTTVETLALERLTHFTGRNDLDRQPDPSVLDQRLDEAESVLRTTVRYTPTDKFTVEGAAEGALNTAETRSVESLNGAPIVLPESNVNLKEDRGDASVTVSWKPNPQFSLDAAVKVEHSTLAGQADAPVARQFDYAKPRVVFVWSPDKDSQLRLHLERETSQIDFSYFVAGSNFASGQISAGNTQYRPPQDWLGEAVVERHFWSTGDLSLTLRRKQLIDQTDIGSLNLPTGLISYWANIGDGFENDIVANLQIPLSRIGLDGGTLKGLVTWSQTQVTDPLTGLHRPISGKSPFVGELHFAEDLPSLQLNVGFDAFYNDASVLYQPFGNQGLGAWGRFNLFAEYRPSSEWNVRGEFDALPGARVHLTTDAFAGLRGLSPLLYHDDENLSAGPTFLLRVRRSFF